MDGDEKKTDLPAERLNKSFRSYIFSRQRDLILELVAPQSGERVLVVGGNAGDYLTIFREKWCLVAGFVSFAQNPQSVRKEREVSADLQAGNPEDLPFSDDEFDVVAVINTLETARDPQKAVAEAVRICRGRIFIGFLNKYSVAGTQHSMKELLGFSPEEKIRLFSIDEIKGMASSVIGAQDFNWGSVIYFPAVVYDISTELEELVPHRKNPLGAFAGLTFPVKYTYRTVQNPVLESYEIKADTQVTAPGALHGTLREAGK